MCFLQSILESVAKPANDRIVREVPFSLVRKQFYFIF
jgi:hypothetical protein